MKSIGIDVSKNGLAIVEISADRNSYQITSGFFQPFTEQSDSDWELATLQTLKQADRQFDFQNCSICVGLSHELVSARNLDFPFNRRSNILKSVPFELEEELPFDLYDAICDIKVTAQQGVNTSVLAYAAPIEVISTCLDYFKKVNISPDIVSIESSAFANIFEDWAEGSFLSEAPNSGSAALKMRVYIRRHNTLVSIFKEQQMLWAQSIPWGENHLIKSLKQVYNLPYQQAAELIPGRVGLLIMTAGADQDQITMSETVAQAIEPLANRIKLMVIDTEDRFEGKVEHIHLLGRMAEVANINAHLAKSMALPFSGESIANDVFTSAQIVSIADFVNDAPIAVGLAIEAAKRPKNPSVNFRKGELAKENQFLTRTWQKWGYAATLCSILYVLCIIYGMARVNIAQSLDDNSYVELTKHAKNIAGLKGSAANPNRISRYINDQESRAKKKKVFSKVANIEPAAKFLNRLSQTLPSNVTKNYDVRRFEINQNLITIEGVAKQKRTVKLIESKLKSFARDKKIQKITPTIGKEKGQMFAYKIKIKR